jgi:hypothetical protein
VNERLRADITTVARIALEHVKVNTAEFGVILRVVEAIKPQPTTPEPAGETVRVRAGVYQDTDGHHVVLGWRFDEGDEVVLGWQLVQLRSQECSYTYDPSELGEPIAIIEADIPLPRIPTVAARVVEGQS